MLTDLGCQWHTGTPWPSPQNGLMAFPVSIRVQGANWIVCCMPVAMCIINVILYSLSYSNTPNGRIAQVTSNAGHRFLLPVDETHPFILVRPLASIPRSRGLGGTGMCGAFCFLAT